MNRKLMILALACAALPLAGCAQGRYTYGMGLTWHSYPYDVWYDGYYGPLYDGYWGTNGFFYFRLNAAGPYRKATDGHFRRDQPFQSFSRLTLTYYSVIYCHGDQIPDQRISQPH